MTQLVSRLSECALFADTPDVGCSLKFLMMCEDYFHLGKREAMPISGLQGSTVTYYGQPREVDSSGWMSCAKIGLGILSIGTVPLVLGVSLLIGRSCFRVEVDRQLFNRELANRVRRTNESWQRFDVERASFNPRPSNHMINGLHIGDGEEFLRCTGSLPPSFSHPRRNYQQVLTLCPLVSMQTFDERLNAEFVLERERLFTNRFQQDKVEWIYFRGIMDIFHGDTIDMMRQKWDILVHDLSLESPLSDFELNGSDRDFQDNARAKSEGVRTLSLDQMFERIFLPLDRAVYEGVETLLHCGMGISRSPTAFALWLMHRTGVTADEAIGYIRYRRRVVNPYFRPFLLQHQQRLAQASIQTTPLAQSPNTARRDDEKWALPTRRALEIQAPPV